MLLTELLNKSSYYLGEGVLLSKNAWVEGRASKFLTVWSCFEQTSLLVKTVPPHIPMHGVYIHNLQKGRQYLFILVKCMIHMISYIVILFISKGLEWQH